MKYAIYLKHYEIILFLEFCSVFWIKVHSRFIIEKLKWNTYKIHRYEPAIEPYTKTLQVQLTDSSIYHTLFKNNKQYL